MKKKKKVTLGGIVNHKNGGVGFKVSCPDTKIAQHYKEMMGFIIDSDHFKVVNEHGYYDKEK